MWTTMFQWVGSLAFVAFITGKVTGVLAAWSWWWLLMPSVPVLAWILGLQ